MTFYTIRSAATAMSESVFLALLTDLVINSGIVDITGTQFQVTGSGSNMSINVAVGRAYLLASGGNAYPFISDAIANVSINTNSSGNPRITSIVIYDNLSATPNSTATNVGNVMAVDGTPASSPSAPSAATIQSAVGASNPYTVIANVSVNSGVSVINTANVTDMRTQVTFKFSQGADGWTSTSDTLVYVSANSFKITGVDRTAVFTKGTRIKFTNNGAVYYGVVISSAFSTDTTVTCAANNDYSINNSSITFPYYSYQTNPQGFPGWFNYTPTWSGYSSSPTVQSAKFNITGTIVNFFIRCNSNGVSNAVTNFVAMPTPINTTWNGNINGYGVDNGSIVTTPLGATYVTGGGNQLQLSKDLTQNYSTWTATGSKSANLQGFYDL